MNAFVRFLIPFRSSCAARWRAACHSEELANFKAGTCDYGEGPSGS